MNWIKNSHISDSTIAIRIRIRVTFTKKNCCVQALDSLQCQQKLGINMISIIRLNNQNQN